MIYKLSIATDRARFKKRCNELFEKKVTVELLDKTIRSLQQNKYVHLCITWFAIEHGLDVEFVKRNYFKRLCNPDLFVTEEVCKFTGEIIEVISSTTTKTTAEITTAIERFRTWSAENGTYLPEPNDLAFLQEIEYEAGKLKEHL